MLTAPASARVSCLALLLLGACGRSNAERPFPPEGGVAPVSPGPGSDPSSPSPPSPPPPSPPAADAGPPSPSTGGAAPDGGGRVDTLPPAGDAAGAESLPGAGCPPVPACDAPPPDPGAKRPWRDFASNLAVVSPPRHRGRDQFLPAGGRQWLIAKFAYGVFDDDIENEDVDIYLLRNCAGAWEKLGTVVTTRDNQHPTVEDVPDSGGRVYFELPADKLLGPGRHRVHFVVGGDLSTTDAFIEVVPRGTTIFVSDVDGTLTTSETEEFGSLLSGAISDANADAARMLTLLAAKGHRPLYLTARPEWLTARTHEFLAKHGFPPGIVHTSLAGTGLTGTAATAFKSAEMASHLGKGLRPVYAFGNTDTDAEAYANGRVEPADKRVFYRYADDKFGGRRIDAWNALEPELSALAPACRP